MNLQLIYLTLNIESKAVGVVNKINAKCEKLNNEKCICNWVNIDENDKSIFVNNEFLSHYDNKNELLKKFNELFKDYVIIFRHVEFSNDIYHLLKNKIAISEHNTIELYEWINIYKHYKFKDWAYLIRTFDIKNVAKKLYFYSISAKNKYKVFSGFIGVTEEIRAYQEKKYYGKLIPSSVISNGVKKRTSKDIDTPIIDEKRGEITFVFFAGDDYIWNNFKRLVDSLLKYNQFKIVYFGTIKPENKITHSNITYFKNYDLIDIQTLNHKNTIGIGTLGLFKKKLNEACPLKVRDYWSLGFPVILGYRDTDVINNKFLEPFVLEFPNDSSLLDYKKIEEFIDQLKKYKRSDITNHLDKISIESKTKEYINFIKSISN
jgi:hypothetical protein